MRSLGRMTHERVSSPGPTTRCQGRVVVLTRNPIAEAIEAIAGTAGREVVVVADDEDGTGAPRSPGCRCGVGDAVVLCDHDAPDAPQVLRDALPRRRRTSR